MNDRLKACVILGAGASMDVGGEGSSIKLLGSHWKPPLAKDLFAISDHPKYQEVLTKYPGAEFLTQNLAPLISSGQINVETALRKYAEHPDSLIRQHFKHIPPYIRDLVYRSSTKYTYSPSSYVQLITNLLAEHKHDLLFIVLNYDNLLEAALSSLNPLHQFDSISKYIVGYDYAKVIKLHGSINWFKQIAQDRNKYTWIEAVNRTDILKTVPEDEIFVIDSVPSTAEYSPPGSNRWVYPVLTAPLAGKNPKDSVCPKSHISELEQFLNNCHKFLIVGTSGLDEDLMALIDTALGSDTKLYRLVHVVDTKKGADEVAIRFRQNVRAFKNSIEQANVFKLGFKQYMNHPLFQQFAGFGLDR